ncbi:hypothetical protein [Hymenobacter baengnokdamensis]|uniref:hypothetical protein n=1 Tax=Hymenobacter baengnokdamensis TaxID=2615203 RepID=UPI001248E963|nr:hypothetical protein [Hymenobacter baengnokdamensis]
MFFTFTPNITKLRQLLSPTKRMKATASLLAFGALLSTAHAQTPVTTPKTAIPRASTYQGPKVVKDTKKLGQKMVQKSKPADMRMRASAVKKKE